jgi:D-glycero-D-manno-heptose 1,7-bisphosphate phosphatase
VTFPLSWVRIPREIGPLSRCLFLDRDGVLNEHIRGGYVLHWSDFVWKSGVISKLGEVGAIGLPMVIVSNQSCVGRGLVSPDQVKTIMSHVVADLDDSGVRLAGWYCCPHTPTDKCACRKPAPGMLLAAQTELQADLQNSYLIGDSPSDMQAGQAVGCATWSVERPSDFVRAIDDVLERERLLAKQCEVTSC